MLCRLSYAAVVAIGLGFACGSSQSPSAPIQVLETRRDAAPIGNEALHGLQRDLLTAGLKQRASDTELYKTNGSLDLMWNDATFFS